MNYSYSISDDIRVIKAKYTGSIDIAFIKAAILALAKDPGFDPTFDTLADFRGCQFFITPDDLYAFRSFYLRVLGNAVSKTALVANTPRETALCIVFQHQIVGSQGIEVFSTLEAAEAWLGVPIAHY